MNIKKKKPSVKAKTKKILKKDKSLGQVTHYFDKINVAVVKLTSTLKVGDYIEFRKDDVAFTQLVESMQVNHKNIQGARIGSEIGLKVLEKVDDGFKVYKAEQPTLVLEPPKPVVDQKAFSYKPIFPAKKKVEERRSVFPKMENKPLFPKRQEPVFPPMVSDQLKNQIHHRNQPQQSQSNSAPIINNVEAPKPVQKPRPERKSAYSDIKFFKF